MNKDIKFHSKILLFGEYAIIKGSKGVALPCPHFFGKLKLAENPDDIHQDLRLNDFHDYLINTGILARHLDLEKFKHDIDRGLYFESNIPLGHGIGSSGALCASIYYHYAHDFKREESYSTEQLKYIQDLMALMESYYHGTSSGLDCLVSLIDRPVLIESRNKLKVIERPDLSKLGSFSLFDTLIERKTSPLVHQFLKQYDEDNEFLNKFEKFQLLNNEAISNLLNNDKEAFKNCFFDISKWQYINFSQMIPRVVKDLWLDGLESKQFAMKLCGAGGGGYFLIYSSSGHIPKDCFILSKL